jgi:hypothetical protein
MIENLEELIFRDPRIGEESEREILFQTRLSFFGKVERDPRRKPKVAFL